MSDDATSEQPAEPALFICIELVPLTTDAVAPEDGTDEIFRKVARAPAGFTRTWRTFETKAEADEYSARSATLTVLPLDLGFNPLLGY